MVYSSGDIPTPLYYPWDTYQIIMYEIKSGQTYAMTNNKLGNQNPSIGGDTVMLGPDGAERRCHRWSDRWHRVPFGPREVEDLGQSGATCADDDHLAYFDDQKNILYYAAFEPNGAGFIDVGDKDPYARAINALANKKIIEGYEDGNFGIVDPVTRQQFSKMILLTMAQYESGQSTRPRFTTSATSSTRAASNRPTGELYAIHYVARASSTGLTFGYPDGTFRPLGNISRQQVITMVVRAAEDVLKTPPADWQGVLSYADAEHGERIRKAEYNGLLRGMVGGTFGGLSGWDTRQNATRGEVAQMLYNLLGALGIPTS